MKSTTEATIIKGSGHIFADLGFSPVVWKGSVRAAAGKKHLEAGAQDSLLWQGSTNLEITVDSALFHIQAPAR